MAKKGRGGQGQKKGFAGTSQSQKGNQKGGGGRRQQQQQRGGDDVLKQEEKLQAIVLADGFVRRFAPITYKTSRTMLPLVNIPMIEFALEFLDSNDIKEIFVFCCTHAETVQNYLQKSSKWGGGRVTLLQAHDCHSMGDALREIHGYGVIDSDFVLIYGDLVTNMSLDKVWNAHKERKKKDKQSNIMTCVLKQLAPDHPTRSPKEGLAIALDNHTGQLLMYNNQDQDDDDNNNDIDDLNVDNDVNVATVHSVISAIPTIPAHGHGQSQEEELKRIRHERRHGLTEVPTNIFLDHPQVKLRNDLVDCDIDICSPIVLYEYTENFDFQEKADFLKSIFNTADILGNRVFSYIIDNEYAARVKDLNTYDAVSKDVIMRWTFPLVPDRNLFDSTSLYTFSRNCVYKEKTSIVFRSCKVGSNTLIGKGSVIDSDVEIDKSVIGANCHIHKKSIIRDSYLWDDVVVEEDCLIQSSILCSNCQILKGANISKGCIISFAVVVGPKIILPPYTNITNYFPDTMNSNASDPDVASTSYIDSDSISNSNFEKIDLGEGGKGYLWKNKPGQEWNSIVPKPLLESEISDEESSDSEEDHPAIPEDEEEKFKKEMIATVFRALKDGIDADNVTLEINGLKFVYNQTIDDVIEILLISILNYAQDTYENINVAVKNVGLIIENYSEVFGKFLENEEDQVSLIWALQDYCEDNDKVSKFFQYILHRLYDAEIITEDAIFTWETESKESVDCSSCSSSSATPPLQFVAQCKAFLTWLREADSESDSES